MTSDTKGAKATQAPLGPDPVCGPTEAACEDFHDDVTLPPGGSDRAEGRGAQPAYMASQGRDLRIDLLRGYFVVAMIVDHVRGQSPLYLLTGGNHFYTSAAEGFIFTSGLVAGLVYQRLIKRDGLAPSLMKVLSRALTLYLLTVGVTLLLLPISEVLYLPWAQGVDLSNPLAVVVSIVTLHRTYYLIDVMLLYTVLFVLVPLAFLLLERGRLWTLMGISWAFWALFQVFPDYAALPWDIAGNYLFDFSAWQALFFTGLALGYHHSRLPTLSHRQTRIALAAAGAAMVVLVALYIVIEAPFANPASQLAATGASLPDLRSWLQEYVFSKVSLRPGRFVASAITFGFMFLLVTAFWSQARRVAGWLLLPLGQHALYAYTAHIAIAATVAIALAPLNLVYPGPEWLNALIQAGSVLGIWSLVRWHVLTPNPKTQRAWNLAPAAIAAVVLLGMYWLPNPTHPGLGAAADQQTASAATSGARRFGTPIPKAAAKPAATATPTSAPNATPAPPAATPTATPAPTLTPTPDPRDSVNLRKRLGGYVGEIDGTLDEQWFHSAALNRDMPYIVYLPSDYGTAGRRYPVLYLLHGRGGHRDEWPAYGAVGRVDEEIRAGEIPPMIVVFPQGDTGFWVDNAGSGPQWGQYVTRDLVRAIDQSYRTLRSPAARAIGGLSMGGWGAMVAAFQHPEVFGVLGVHGPSLYGDDGSLPFLGTGAEFAQRNPLALAASLPVTQLQKLQIWIDAGVDDPWLPETTALHDSLAARGIDHTWQSYPGGHDYDYWSGHLTDYMHFYGHALSRK